MADWLTKMQQACTHPICEETVYYGVPMGVTIENPEPPPGVEPDYHIPTPEEVAANPQDYTYDWYYRAWCPICKKWKEPLLSKDGTSYMDEG